MKYLTAIKARADLALTSSGEQTRDAASRTRESRVMYHLTLLSSAASAVAVHVMHRVSSLKANYLMRPGVKAGPHSRGRNSDLLYFAVCCSLSTFPFLSLFRLLFAVPTTPTSSPWRDSVLIEILMMRNSETLTGGWLGILTIVIVSAWVSQLADLQFQYLT